LKLKLTNKKDRVASANENVPATRLSHRTGQRKQLLPDQSQTPLELALPLRAGIYPDMLTEPVIRRIGRALRRIEHAIGKARLDISGGNITHDMVEHVEDLHARLDVKAFADAEILEQGHVPEFLTVAAKRIDRKSVV